MKRGGGIPAQAKVQLPWVGCRATRFAYGGPFLPRERWTAAADAIRAPDGSDLGSGGAEPRYRLLPLRVGADGVRRVRVGEDILNRCTKCGVVVHVIVALVDHKIAKVECKECGSRHRHRPLEAKKVRASGNRKTRARAAQATPPSPEPDSSRPVRPYLVTETYRVGDRIDHRSLGRGVVEEVVGVTKVRVSFADGTKTLVHGRGS